MTSTYEKAFNFELCKATERGFTFDVSEIVLKGSEPVAPKAGEGIKVKLSCNQSTFMIGVFCMGKGQFISRSKFI